MGSVLAWLEGHEMAGVVQTKPCGDDVVTLQLPRREAEALSEFARDVVAARRITRLVVWACGTSTPPPALGFSWIAVG